MACQSFLPRSFPARLRCTRGEARLAEQLNPKTKLGMSTRLALSAGGFDFVVLQEMSTAAVASPASFERSVQRLASLVRAQKGVPILFETWAFCEGCPRLAARGLAPSSMQDAITSVCRSIADRIVSCWPRSERPSENVALPLRSMDAMAGIQALKAQSWRSR